MALDGLSDYWRRGVRRRRFLGVSVALTGSAAFLAACSSNNKNNAPANNAPTNTGAANSGTVRPSTGATGASPTPAASFRPSASGVKQGGTYTTAFTGPFAGVDPHNSVYGGAGIVPQVYEYLVRKSLLAQDQGVIPQLATKYELGADQLTTIFTLRNDAMIQQNNAGIPVRPIDSSDVKANFDRILDPKVASNGYAWTSTWIDKYDTPDPQTFRIITKKPYAWLLDGCGYNLQTAIAPKELLTGGANLKTTAVGSGPFTLTSLEEGNQAVMTKNPTYWQKDSAGNAYPYLNQLVIKAFADQTTYRTAFSGGQIDVYGAQNVDEGKQLASSAKGTAFYTDPGFGYLSFWQRIDAPPWSDARIRRAVWRAMNPQQYIQIIGHNDAVEIGLLTYSLAPYALPIDQFNKLAGYDPQQAKQLLQAAGQPNLTFTFSHSTSSNVVDYVNIFVQQMQAVGITAKADPQDAGTWVANYFSNKLTASLSLNQEYAWPEIPLLWYRTGGITGNNHYDTGFHTPDIDAAIDKAAQTLDTNARIQAYQDAQTLVIQNDPPFWNFMGLKAYADVSPAVQNYPHGIGANLGYYYARSVWLNR